MVESRCSTVKNRPKSNYVWRARLYLLRIVTKLPLGEGERGGGLCFSPILCSPLPSSSGLGSTERNRIWRRRESSSGGGSGRARARRPAFAVQLSVRVGVGERGEDGAAWLPASVCCAVSLRLSSPTGAILRSFLLSSRRVGRCRRALLGPFLFLSRKTLLSRALRSSPRNPRSCLLPPSVPPPLSFFKEFLQCVVWGERWRILGSVCEREQKGWIASGTGLFRKGPVRVVALNCCLLRLPPSPA